MNSPSTKEKKRSMIINNPKTISFTPKTQIINCDEVQDMLMQNYDYVQPVSDRIVNDFKVQSQITTNYEDFQNDVTDIQALEFIKILKSQNKQLRMFSFVVLTDLFQNSLTEILYFVFLLDQYTNTPLSEDDSVRIFGKFDKILNSIVIERFDDDQSQQNNYILIDPSILITPSQIIERQFCGRKQVLKNFFQPTQTELNDACLVGIIVHNFFQFFIRKEQLINFKELIIRDYELTQGLLNELKKNEQISKQKDFQDRIPYWIKDKLNQLYSSQILNAYQIQMNFNSLLDKSLLVALQSIIWILKHIIQKFPIQINPPKYSKSASQKAIRIDEVLEIEKYLETYDYGFCGKIDCLLRCSLIELGKKSIELLVPLELKTGKKQNHGYRMQSIIYSILIQKNYPSSYSDYSLLYYIYDNDCQIIETNTSEWHSIVFERNFIAKNQKKSRQDCYLQEIPDVLESIRNCNMCQMSEVCSSIKIVNNADVEDTPTEFQAFMNVKGRMIGKSIDYFKEQMRLLYNEEIVQIVQMSKEIQVFRSSNIQTLFKWFEDKFISKQVQGDSLIEFEFCVESPQMTMNEYLQLQNQYQYGENITIICDEIGLKMECIIILLNKRIVSNKDQDSKQYIIMDDEESSEPQSIQSQSEKYEAIIELQVQSVIDLDNILNIYEKLKTKLNQNDQIKWIIRQRKFNPFPQYRTAVISLIVKDEYQAFKNIIINGSIPIVYEEQQNQVEIFQEKRIKGMLYLKNNLENQLNTDQIQAIKRSLDAEYFHVILGFPGTGKTFLLAKLLEILAFSQCKVLVLSYTHSALENIIKALNNESPQLMNVSLRFCSNKYKASSISEKILFNPKLYDDIDLLESSINCKYLFFTTCLSSNHQVLKSIKFDYCIIDEASQIIEPLCIANLLMGKKFILIGDYNQLQPLVKSEIVQKDLSVSLLERLSKKYPKHTSKLTFQFRMNDQIMKLSNQLVYEDQLQLANHSQSQQRLRLNNPNHQNNPILIKIFDTQTSVIFLNYSVVMMNEINREFILRSKKKKISSQFSIDNLVTEADIVFGLVRRMIDAGLKSSQVGIICTYNKSANTVQNRFNGQFMREIQILTIDKSQGIEKDCIILVFSPFNDTNGLMNNWRRINVAMTRAKSKLIIIGNEEHLVKSQNMIKFIQVIKNEFNIEELDRKFITLISGYI